MRVEGVRDDDPVLGEQVIFPLQVSVSSVVGGGWPRVFSEIQLSSFGSPRSQLKAKIPVQADLFIKCKKHLRVVGKRAGEPGKVHYEGGSSVGSGSFPRNSKKHSPHPT